MDIWKNKKSNDILYAEKTGDLSHYLDDNNLTSDDIEFLFEDGYKEFNIQN